MKTQQPQEKFKKSIENTNFEKLSQKEQDFLEDKFKKLHFSFQEIRQIIDIAVDLEMWNEKAISEIYNSELEQKYEAKKLKQEVIKEIKLYWENLKNSQIDYANFKDIKIKAQKIKITDVEKKSVGFGMCPVASPKTRCCNLLTLDSVESCGFDCSYCSIQSFYNENKIVFDSSFAEKLKNIEIDPDEIYHIGTGQSSDSLMWGNRYDILDTLVDFAKKYPNVILEFKTKSNRIEYFLENKIPKNILLTWSLNPQTIIDNEEHLTASIKERLESARKVAQKGIIVGFHFHPMVYYKNWKEEYGEIFKYLVENFTPSQVALVSIGTLTFIKPVIKKIRKRDFKSKILQMPLVDAEGKFSYPLEIKREMFKFAYDSLKPWHKEVYFYMCMENHSLWKDVFGYEYPTNESFEMDMKLSYMGKIKG